MMKIMIYKYIMDSICESIRRKLKTDKKFKPEEVPAAIDSFTGTDLVSGAFSKNGKYYPPEGKDGFSDVAVNVPQPTLNPMTATENGEYKPGDDADGYSKVTVNVNPPLQAKTATQNGTFEPDAGYYGLSQVEVDVEPKLQAKTATQNGQVSPDSGYDGLSEVTVDVGSGALSMSAKDVNFIDYDGTIVYAYTAAQFAELTAMPANPSHAGLTSQGWNWTFADAQAHVANHDKLYIGQMYVTDDNKTRLYIHLEQGRLDPTLTFSVSETRRVVIDWGDGNQTPISAISLDKITEQHHYSQPGDYTITIQTDGKIRFTGDSNTYAYILGNGSTKGLENACYRNALKKVELGSNVALDQIAFANCRSLSSITIPEGITTIGDTCFQYCISLKSATIPSGVTAISDKLFQNCSGLPAVSIPNGIVSVGNYAFASTNLLKEIVFHDSVKSIGTYAFYLSNIASIKLPDNITTISNSIFLSCDSLSEIVLPESVTTISTAAFRYCEALAAITIPSAVTRIESNVFGGCEGLGEIHFKGATPPTVANTSAWKNIPTDCKIYVPTGTLSAYTSAASYPDPATYTYVEE